MGGAVVRALASLQCGPDSFSSPEPLGLICNRPRNDGLLGTRMGPGSNHGVKATRGLSLSLVLFLVPRGFSPDTPVFPSPEKPTLPTHGHV